MSGSINTIAMHSNKRIVFGLGTGRCGTVSLARLLNGQNNASVTHECEPFLSWIVSPTLIRNRIEELFARDEDFVGDVAFYYLPYVEQILAIAPKAKFICLRRPKNEVVKSFLKKCRKQNHWVEHDGTKWKASPRFDGCFPKYATRSKRRAIGMYWDEYYQRMAILIGKYPNSIRLFDLDDGLNTNDGVQEILGFLGIPSTDQVIDSQHANKSDFPTIIQRTASLARRVLKKFE